MGQREPGIVRQGVIKTHTQVKIFHSMRGKATCWTNNNLNQKGVGDGKGNNTTSVAVIASINRRLTKLRGEHSTLDVPIHDSYDRLAQMKIVQICHVPRSILVAA